MAASTEQGEPRIASELCGPADRAEQARLFNACFKKSLGAGELAWRYDQNPHGTAVSLLSRPEAGDGVSGYACSPRRVLTFGKEESSVGETGDVMTHPDWRGRGLFRELDAACMEHTARLGWPCVIGLPNNRSAHIFVRIGWDRIGALRSYTFLLEKDAAARAERLREGRLAALLTSLGRRAGQRARKRLRRAAGSLEARPLERFPEEVLELSRTVERRFAFMVRRDADYLNWRFVDNPSGLHRAIGVYESAREGRGRLAGYAVVQLPRAGQRLGYLVDVLAASDEAVAAAIEAGLAALAAEGVSAVRATAIDGSWWSRSLRSSGFLAPRSRNHLIVILYTHAPEEAVAQAARRASDWYFTDADRDDETMG